MKLLKLTLGLGVLAAATGCTALGQYAQSASALNGGTPNTAGATPATSPALPTAPAPSEAAAEGKASGPTTVSVSIKNSCGKTAKVFFGDKPKFGSGTYSTIGDNTRTSHTFDVGDHFWLVDDGQNGLSSVEIGDSVREIEIGGACDQVTTH
ncbi:MAG: hypothetical protein KC776_02960 [Myxococcales bacterium]|nr:hypothetical protein [Myxococcales bacterium]MCB9581230.1 hypothetical protein [Polyangiaceae bacterium]